MWISCWCVPAMQPQQRPVQVHEANVIYMPAKHVGGEGYPGTEEPRSMRGSAGTGCGGPQL